MEEEKDFYLAIGRNIRILREKSNFKQDAFAQLLGLSRASIVNIEKGRQNPSLFLIWKMSKIFNIGIEELLGLSSSLTPNIVSKLPPSIEKKLNEIIEPDIKMKLTKFFEENLIS